MCIFIHITHFLSAFLFIWFLKINYGYIICIVYEKILRQTVFFYLNLKVKAFNLKKNEYFMSHELFVGACSYYFVCFKSIFFEYILSILYCAFSFLCVILYLSSKMKLWKKYNYCIIRMKWAKIFIGAQYYCIRKRILYFQIVQECLSF